MSISPVGGASPVQTHVPVASQAKPESREVPGAADRDGDSDNHAAQAPVAPRGTVNVKA